MRAHLVCVFLCATLGASAASAAPAAVLLDFEDAGVGDVLDERYAHRGATFTAQGNGGPFPVIADAACVGGVNQVMSLRPVEDCPESSNFWGFFVVEFEIPQPRVAITAIADGPASVVYLEAYDEIGLLDQKIGQAGEEWDGVPQRLEITREAGERWITRIEASALRSGGRAAFDDVEYEIAPVPTVSSSWSAVKARF